MSEYQKIVGKPLPKNTLVLPLQYKALNILHQIALFLELGKEIVHGPINLQEASVVEMLGRVPFPEITSLKGKKITLYRPSDDITNFADDMQQMISLPQFPIKNNEVVGNLTKIRGHSLYIQKISDDNVISCYDPTRFVNIICKAVQSITSVQRMEPVVEEILSDNQVIAEPFMMTESLPISLLQGFTGCDFATLSRNLYDMLNLVTTYSQNGIYFNRICPEYFRFTQNGLVKLLVTSHFSKHKKYEENRYATFFKNTITEYLPNLVTWYLRTKQNSKIIRYFENFPEGICIGMLERVFRRIFLSEYMSEKYDSIPCSSGNFVARLEQVIVHQWQEDLELFRCPIPEIPEEDHFNQYRSSLASLLLNRGYSLEISDKLSYILTILRKFSYPVFTDTSCQSYLVQNGIQVTAASLSYLVASILNLVANKNISQSGENAMERTTIRKVSTAFQETRRLAFSYNASEKVVSSTKIPTERLSSVPRTLHEINEQKIPESKITTQRLPVFSSTGVSIGATEVKDSSESKNIQHKTFGDKTQRFSVLTKHSFLESDNKQVETSILETKSYRTEQKPLKTQRLEQMTRQRPFTKSIPQVMRAEKFGVKEKSDDDVCLVVRDLDKAFYQQARELMEFVKKLGKIQELVSNDIKFAEKLKTKFFKLLSSGTIFTSLEEFLTNANLFLQSQEAEFDFLRLAQLIIPDDIHVRISDQVSQDIRMLITNNPSWAKRCRRLLTAYLIRIIKTRFLLEADKVLDIQKVLPNTSEDVIEYIFKYDLKNKYRSKMEFFDKIVLELDQMDQR